MKQFTEICSVYLDLYFSPVSLGAVTDLYGISKKWVCGLAFSLTMNQTISQGL